MQPFRVRFRRFSLQVPGEILVFLLVKALARSTSGTWQSTRSSICPKQET